MGVFVKIASWLFGLMLVGLSGFVSLETLARKIFNFSFQGADELGGYVLAVSGSLAFTIAMLERGHIRLDFVHERLPPRVQGVLNWLSCLLLAVLGLFFARYCYTVISETLDYRSTAATLWATPLIYPQSLWYLALLSFSLASLILALKATGDLIRGDTAALNRRFGPKTVREEVDEEVGDFRQR